MADQTSSSPQQPLLRPTKTRNEQKIKGKNPFEIVANTVLALSKEWGDFLYAKLTEYPAKFIGGRPFAPFKVEDAIRDFIDPFNKDSILRKVANAAMAPFSYMRDIQQGFKTDQNAKKEDLGIERIAKKIYADHCNGVSLSPQQKQWFDEQLKLEKFNGKLPEAEAWDGHAEELGMLHTLYGEGRGRS